MNDKIIISCAVAGSIHTPTMSPHFRRKHREMLNLKGADKVSF